MTLESRVIHMESHEKFMQWQMHAACTQGWDTLPLYHKLMVVLLGYNGTGPRPVPVTVQQKKAADRLSEDIALRNALDGCLGRINHYIPPENRDKIYTESFFRSLFGEYADHAIAANNLCVDIGRNFLGNTNELCTLILSAASNAEDSRLMQRLWHIQKNTTRLLADALYRDELLNEYRRALEIFSGSRDEAVQKKTKHLLFCSGFYTEQAISEFLRVKINRANVLFNIDKVLGYLYLAYSPFDPEKLPEDISSDNRVIIYYDPEDICRFIIRDNELYRSIVGSLEVQEAREEKKNMLRAQGTVSGTVQRQLINAILYNGSGSSNTSQEIRKRVQYFVEEDLPRYIDIFPEEKYARLAESLRQFNLQRKMKRGPLKDTESYYWFFDDILLKYIRIGQVPSKEQLCDLYGGLKHEKNSVADRLASSAVFV